MRDTFITVATFQYSSEALVIKGRLEAEGVEVVMADHHTIDVDPLISNAIGGVKLKVRGEDRDKALRILKMIRKYSLDDEGNTIQCPNCNSDKVEYFTNVTDFKSFISFLFGFLFGALPFYVKYEYRCEVCKKKFNV
ncbi:putative signal transducing protein [Sinomicrobium sp. M5D2P9]